jgi:hypothetical protein
MKLLCSTINALVVFANFFFKYLGDSLYVIEKAQLIQDDNDFRSDPIAGCLNNILSRIFLYLIEQQDSSLGLRRSLCVKLFEMNHLFKQTS